MKAYKCSICGYSPDNRADWCALGCGNDYNKMIEINLCTKCKTEEAECDFGEEENLCQMCFEEVCSVDWWQGVDEGWIF
jgi:hypothetical protein